MNSKKLISILALLILISGIAYGAENIKDKMMEKYKQPAKDIIPPEAGPLISVEQSAYTDLWTKADANTYSNYWNFNKWINIPGMSQTITTKFPTTLTVSVNTEYLAHYGTVLIRVLIDGYELSPGPVTWGDDFTERAVRSFTFFKSYLSTGTHSVKVQYLLIPDEGRGEITLWYKTLIITVNGYGH